MPEINVALIGYAFMGRAHSNAYRQVSAFFTPALTPRMKVLCGRTRAKVEHAARQYGWDEASTDWREVIARQDIQLVDISTSGDSHAEIAIAAAEAGKAVICEKPLARTLAEAERMLAAVRQARVPNMVCHNYRRAPAVMLAHQLIADGTLGQIRHFRGTYLQDWLVDPNAPRSWRLDRAKAGAGTLGDIGSHVIDLARFLVGEITDVTGALETFVKERPLPDDASTKAPVTVDDAAAAVVRFANGALGTIEATRYATGPQELQPLRDQRQPRQRRVRSGTDERARAVSGVRPTGRARVPHDSRHRSRASVHQGVVAARARHRVGAHVHAHRVRFARGDGAGTPASPSFEDGVANQRVMDAIERAAAAKNWVTL